ncbi:MAG: site-specific DNA-methyltransferase [Bacteroidia bacterium]|nr:site-specific DNA-methyltransferase [Bacteroidia bacterium]
MTELIWDGKYKDGKKVAPVRIPLPFQTIETVNESTEDRKKTIDLFASGKPTEWRNRLIWGDKKYVLPSLLPEFAGKVDLIYIDPPFNAGADFTYRATIADNPDTEEDERTEFVKEPSIIEQKAYRDTWGRGLDSYLQWFYDTIVILRDLLSQDGSLYVHLDYNMMHYAKVALDEVFGQDYFQNEIVWKRTGAHNSAKRYGPVHDVILFYTKSATFVWNQQYQDNSKYVEQRYATVDENGRRFQAVSLIAAGIRSGSSGRSWRGIDVTAKGNHWRYTIAKLDELDKNGDIYWPERGGLPRLKMYAEDVKGSLVQDWWDDIPPVNSQASERLGYQTQKPEALLERLIRASSNEGNLILDCFCGSGTTVAVSERLKRRWISCDLGRFAIHTTRKRLLQMEGISPFVIQNLGKYERQAWQELEFQHPENRSTQEQLYRYFILDLFRAEPVKGFLWLHGKRGKRMVHVGAVDAPISLGDVKAIIQEFWKSAGKATDINTNGVDILGWEFAFDINETARQQAIASKVDIKFKKIPREVLEQKAVDAGDIKFFELAGLDVKTKATGKAVRLSLNDFIIPPDDVPDEVRSAITHWSQWIDYWAVDWDYKDDTFHNEWQTYRTKKEPKLLLEAKHEYESKGNYIVVIKVIDILGNDTTKAISVKVG